MGKSLFKKVMFHEDNVVPYPEHQARHATQLEEGHFSKATSYIFQALHQVMTTINIHVFAALRLKGVKRRYGELLINRKPLLRVG